MDNVSEQIVLFGGDEAEFIRQRLIQHQAEVITLCQDYDDMKSKAQITSSHPSYPEYALIKRAVTLITCLEELVQISCLKIEQSSKE